MGGRTVDRKERDVTDLIMSLIVFAMLACVIVAWIDPFNERKSKK